MRPKVPVPTARPVMPQCRRHTSIRVWCIREPVGRRIHADRTAVIRITAGALVNDVVLADTSIGFANWKDARINGSLVAVAPVITVAIKTEGRQLNTTETVAKFPPQM